MPPDGLARTAGQNRLRWTRPTSTMCTNGLYTEPGSSLARYLWRLETAPHNLLHTCPVPQRVGQLR